MKKLTQYTRRQVIAMGAAAGVGIYFAKSNFQKWKNRPTPWNSVREAGMSSQVFIARATHYSMDLKGILLAGFHELGVSKEEIFEKTILLKPNLVEPQFGQSQINTHPLVVRAAIEAFLHLGAKKVLVAEAAGHRRDSEQILQESGLVEVLREDKILFKDLNYETGYEVLNKGGFTGIEKWIMPALFREVDWVVSMPKLKTHHWAGVTLAMKNLFGVLPGIYYGWPKNVLHHVGVQNSILDLAATVKPHFSIVDGIIGMEGDGPIMGDAKKAGVLVMGRDFTSVDATATRVMQLDPTKIGYLKEASGWLGPIGEEQIQQRGEKIVAVSTPFRLEEKFESMRGIRLK
jgi:uncharacterized protein (DUF362 family)